jgi:hypothetical protein
MREEYAYQKYLTIYDNIKNIIMIIIFQNDFIPINKQ